MSEGKVLCVCVRMGQTRGDDGVIKFYEVGDKDYFAKCPKHFVEVKDIDAEKTDVSLVNDKILRDPSIIPIEELVKFYRDKYNEDLTGLARSVVVEKILYARHNVIEALSAGAGSKGVLAQDFKDEPQKAKKKNDSGLSVVMADEQQDIPAPKAEEKQEDDLDSLL